MKMKMETKKSRNNNLSLSLNLKMNKIKKIKMMKMVSNLLKTINMNPLNRNDTRWVWDFYNKPEGEEKR